MNGLKSHPVANNSISSKSTEDGQNFMIRSGPAVKRGPQLVAKDARMESTNTSDLKDFFRSTGPDPQDPINLSLYPLSPLQECRQRVLVRS